MLRHQVPGVRARIGNRRTRAERKAQRHAGPAMRVEPVASPPPAAPVVVVAAPTPQVPVVTVATTPEDGPEGGRGKGKRGKAQDAP